MKGDDAVSETSAGKSIPMNLNLANANVVIAAQHFNPSIVNQLWLVDNEIVGRDDFQQGCIFTDMMVHIVSREFALLVAMEQLQFVPFVETEHQQELILSRLGHLIETLPHTPYSAAGLNFTWHLKPEAGDVRQFSRDLFYVGSRSLCQAFDADDARFGGYFSKNILGGRLKLDVKPITVRTKDAELELMQFAFNLHLDIGRTKNAVDDIRSLLMRWDEAREETDRIMQEVHGGLQ